MALFFIKFGASRMDFQVDYWMEGIDDGRNRIDSDKIIVYIYVIVNNETWELNI